MKIINEKIYAEIFPYFSTLSSKEWQEFSIEKINPFVRHDIKEGHIFKHIFFVISGCLRVYKIGENTGREITLYRVNSGECCILMLSSILSNTAYSASIDIEKETEVLLLPIDTFKEFLNKHKSLQTMIYTQFVIKMSEISNLIEKVTFEPIQLRLYEYLYEKHKLNQTTIKITQEKLAIELGTAREVVSRNLKLFSEKGALTISRGKIHIIDLYKIKI